MSEGWRPLSVREGGGSADYDALHEGVPAWLQSSLQNWVDELLYGEYGGQRLLRPDALRSIERSLRLDLFRGGDPYDARSRLLAMAKSEQEGFLDVVDSLLHTGSDVEQAGLLDYMLQQGGSAWRVVEDSDRFALERRVALPVADAEALASQAGRAGRMLQRAWHAVYGRSPDPSAAYREAVRAVEAAAQPVVTPNDPKATLGKMIAAIRDAPRKFKLVLSVPGGDAVAKMLGMMELLWQGQHDRHGDSSEDKPLNVNQDEAEAAVHLAVTLVQWFSSGAISIT